MYLKPAGIPGRNEKCPCGSKKKSKHCCLSSGGFFYKKPTAVHGLLKTGVKNQKCFANVDQKCVEKISKEHIFPHAILKTFEDGVIASGFRWIPANEERPVGASRLTASVLCQAHNSAFAPFDEAAVRIYSCLQRYELDFNEGKHAHEFRLESGYDFERWAAKAILGLDKSGSHPSWNSRSSSLPSLLKEQALDFLLEGREWKESGAGLYFFAGRTSFTSNGRSFGAAPLFEDGSVVGLSICVAGFEFNLCLNRPKTIAGLSLSRFEFRPSLIKLKANESLAEKSLELSWENSWARRREVILTLGAQPGGLPE